MKSLLPLFALTILPATLAAQKTDFKVNASANISVLPAFNNQIIIVNGFIVPGAISVANAANPPMTTSSTSSTKSQIGFNVEVEAGKKLSDRWKISLSLGINQIRFDYDTHIYQSVLYKNDFDLSELTTKYGDSKFTYLSSRPFNVSLTFNRFALQAGPIISYLIGKKYSNYVLVSNTGTGEAIGAFFESKGDIQKFLYGAHLNARIGVAKNLEIMLGGQYFLNSLYKKEVTYKPIYDKSKALQFQLGLSYNFAAVIR
ncbi:outer membrane beta-barrel protein [Chitinophaga sp. 22321]|uniref:TonB-dependent receptor n=1 Tax=Chitinophaga hostae TaxID=2831022 RepID=A0ABS5ISB6_9BACT|nr:outer membrane beta-barrel protein [Chitinophaga hostae]MBS0025849.1 TonB-dependent receptor [Chitinophaga hostae]